MPVSADDTGNVDELERNTRAHVFLVQQGHLVVNLLLTVKKDSQLDAPDTNKQEHVRNPTTIGGHVLRHNVEVHWELVFTAATLTPHMDLLECNLGIGNNLVGHHRSAGVVLTVQPNNTPHQQRNNVDTCNSADSR